MGNFNMIWTPCLQRSSYVTETIELPDDQNYTQLQPDARLRTRYIGFPHLQRFGYRGRGFNFGFLIRHIVYVNVAYPHHKLLNVHLMQRRGSGSSVHYCGFVSEVEGFRSLVFHSIPILKHTWWILGHSHPRLGMAEIHSAPETLSTGGDVSINCCWRIEVRRRPNVME